MQTWNHQPISDKITFINYNWHIEQEALVLQPYTTTQEAFFSLTYKKKVFPGDWRADLLCMFCMHASTFIYRWITILYKECSQVSTVLILKVLSFSTNVRWRGIKLSSPRHIFLPNVYMTTQWVLGPHPSSNSPLILIFKFSDSILHGCEAQVDKQIDSWQYSKLLLLS